MSGWRDEYLQQIEDCEKRAERLTDWETNFIDSLRRQVERGRSLSDRQIETLDGVWERITKRG
jgi:hypothetical protein